MLTFLAWYIAIGFITWLALQVTPTFRNLTKFANVVALFVTMFLWPAQVTIILLVLFCEDGDVW